MAGRKQSSGLTEQQAALPKKYKKTSHDAAGSLQPHMLYARREIRKLVMEKLSDGTPPAARTDKEPFEYSVVDGQLYVKLRRPILRKEVKAIIDPISESIKKVRSEWKGREGITKKSLRRGEFPPEISMPTSLDIQWKEGQAPSKARMEKEEVITEEGDEIEEETGLGNILFAKFPLLALTSKMGCFSFNMPAGPATHQFYGTCLASSYGFPMLNDNERPRKASKWLNEIMGKELTREDFFLDTEDAKGSKFHKDFLCSGCYGLKGLYGSPMIFTMMECRKQFVETMIQKRYRSQFVTIMTKAIRMAQAQSITSRFILDEMGMQDQMWAIPDPAYFRIHDVGDVFHEHYLEAWFQVIRNCAEPMKLKKMGFTLPAIRFWMPTRMWIFPGKVSDHFKCKGIKTACVPDNLTIRPSAVHFGDAAPALKGANGMSVGATSTGIGEALAPQDIEKARAVVGKLYHEGGKGWICPAYLGPEQLGGGGAEWAPMGGKRKGLQLVGGACARAFGPDGEKPVPKGKGCRACWDRPDLKIVYPEH